MPGTESDKRLVERQPVLRSAKLLYDGSVLDCLVLDSSATGVRVGTELPVQLPSSLVLELRSGGRWAVERRWQRGVETGLAYVGFAGLSIEAALQAGVLLARLRNAGVLEVTAELAGLRHFDNEELRAAAAAAEATVIELERVLKTSATG